MDNLNDANSALINYIDSLLWEGEKNADQTRPKTVADGDAVARVDDRNCDPNALRALFVRSAGIPLAISAQDLVEVIDAKQASLLHRDAGEAVAISTFRYQGRDIYAVDTREIILPDGHPARHDLEEQSCEHIVMLAGYDLGLMCDEVGEIVELDRQEVEWRQQRQTRSWLAGMVKTDNHALLDIKEIIRVCRLDSFSID